MNHAARVLINTFKNRPLRIAHRGGKGLAPENTLHAFRTGMLFKPDAVELDCHMSKDGVVVVVHDPKVDKYTTAPHGPVCDLTFSELQQLNASAHFLDYPLEPQRFPSLLEVLEVCRGKCHVHIEIKVRGDFSVYEGMEEKIVNMLHQLDMIDQVVIIAFGHGSLQRIHELEPRLRTCALVSTRYLASFGNNTRENIQLSPEIMGEVSADIVRQGFNCVGFSKRYLSSPFCQMLRDLGVFVGVWTVNDVEDMRKFHEMKVSFITSDRPDLLLTLFNQEDTDTAGAACIPSCSNEVPNIVCECINSVPSR